MSAKITEMTFAVDKNCPLCGTAFRQQKLLSKKVSAKEIDLALKNLYAPGLEIEDPIIYSVIVCPGCLFAAYEGEFDGTRIDGREFRKAKAASEDVARAFGMKGEDFRAPRAVRAGLVGYYLAEIWYAIRPDFGYRNFRLAQSLYRRTWLMEAARRSGIVNEEFFRQDRAYALQSAELYFERSFLEDRPPERFFYGPDYGYDFGPAGIPYLVSYCNFLLASDRESGVPLAVRSARYSKAKKFADCAGIMAIKEGPEELKRKLERLKPMLVGLKREIDAEERMNSAENLAVQFETMDWEIPLEKLYEQYGVAKKKDDIIVREGDKSREMYFVLDGVVNVIKAYRSGDAEEQRLIAVLSTGSFIGEMSLLDGAPRFATIKAAGPVRLVRVDAEDLQAIIKAYPTVALRIMSVLSARLRNYDDFVQKRLLSLISVDRLTSTDSTGKTSSNKDTLTAELNGLMSEVDRD